MYKMNYIYLSNYVWLKIGSSKEKFLPKYIELVTEGLPDNSKNSTNSFNRSIPQIDNPPMFTWKHLIFLPTHNINMCACIHILEKQTSKISDETECR